MLRQVIQTRAVKLRKGGEFEVSYLRHDLVCDVCGAVAPIRWQHQTLWHQIDDADTDAVLAGVEARDRVRRQTQAGWPIPSDELDLCPTCQAGEPPL